MNINDFEIGEEVEVFIQNPRLGNIINNCEWRKGVVVDKKMVYPTAGLSNRPTKPYPSFSVKAIHTYANVIDNTYETLNNGVKVFKDYVFDIYDKENTSNYYSEREIRKIC